MELTTVYDVCSDYSLEIAMSNHDVTKTMSVEDLKQSPEYDWRKGNLTRGTNKVRGEIGVHKLHQEIHYFIGPEGLAS